MAKYSIEKHNNLGYLTNGNYVLWKEVDSKHGFCVKGIFHGTRKACEEELKRLREIEEVGKNKKE